VAFGRADTTEVGNNNHGNSNKGPAEAGTTNEDAAPAEAGTPNAR
jgi:hypothetical protein